MSKLHPEKYTTYDDCDNGRRDQITIYELSMETLEALDTYCCENPGYVIRIKGDKIHLVYKNIHNRINDWANVAKLFTRRLEGGEGLIQ